MSFSQIISYYGSTKDPILQSPYVIFSETMISLGLVQVLNKEKPKNKCSPAIWPWVWCFCFFFFNVISSGESLRHPSAQSLLVYPNRTQLLYSDQLLGMCHWKNYLYNFLNKKVGPQIKTLYFFICTNKSFYVTWSKRRSPLTWPVPNCYINF